MSAVIAILRNTLVKDRVDLTLSNEDGDDGLIVGCRSSRDTN